MDSLFQSPSFRALLILLLSWIGACLVHDGEAQAQAPTPVSNDAIDAIDASAWPESWTDYHLRFEAFKEGRRKHIPQVKLEFDPEGMTFSWVDLPPQWSEKLGLSVYSCGKIELERSVKDKTSEGIEFLFEGEQFNRVAEPGIYFAALRHWIDGAAYQTISNTVAFEVTYDETESRFIAEERKPGTLGSSHVGDAEWRQWEDFHSYDTGRPLPEKFPSFEPSANVYEIEGPSVKSSADELGTALLPYLEWQRYLDGRLVLVADYVEHRELPFDHGPGAYVTLLVAKHNGVSVPISAPLQSFFPDEGNGKLSLTPTDSDGDGVPDYWEKKFHLDPDDPFDTKDEDKSLYKYAVKSGMAR